MTSFYNHHVTRYRRLTDTISLTFLTNQDARGVKKKVQNERIFSSTSDQRQDSYPDAMITGKYIV